MKDNQQCAKLRDDHDDRKSQCKFCGVRYWDERGWPIGSNPKRAGDHEQCNSIVEPGEHGEREELESFRYQRDRYEYLRNKYGPDKKESS